MYEDQEYVTIVAIAGYPSAKAGKDTFANFIQQKSKKTYCQRAFSSKLRQTFQAMTNNEIKAEDTLTNQQKAQVLSRNIFGNSDLEISRRLQQSFAWADINGCLNDEKKLQEMVSILKNNAQDLTIGRSLQLLGTDIGRNYLSETIWIDCIEKPLIELPQNSLITDPRFPNEADMLEKLLKKLEKKYPSQKFQVLMVEVNAEKRCKRSEIMEDGRLSNHPSEVRLSSKYFIEFLDNNGSLQDFEKIAENFIEKYDL